MCALKTAVGFLAEKMLVNRTIEDKRWVQLATALEFLQIKNAREGFPSSTQGLNGENYYYSVYNEDKNQSTRGIEVFAGTASPVMYLNELLLEISKGVNQSLDEIVHDHLQIAADRENQLLRFVIERTIEILQAQGPEVLKNPNEPEEYLEHIFKRAK